MKQKNIGLCGLGNSIVDVFAQVDEQIFSTLGRDKSSMQLVDSKQQVELLEKLSGENPQASGGSVANSVFAFAQLGGKAAFLTSLGDDARGNFYQHEFGDLGIALPGSITSGSPTGTSLVIITPDAERTMSTDLGAAVLLNEKHLCAKTIANSEWLFIEGYVFSNSEESRLTIKKAVEIAKAEGTKIALTLSDTWVVSAFEKAIAELLPDVTLLFSNESEVCTFTKAEDVSQAQRIIGQKVPNYVITCGERGAVAHFDGKTVKIDAVACQPVDLTGAGDMFAGVFLHSLHQKFSLEDAGSAACKMAGQVIQQVGARLPSESFHIVSERKAS